MPLTSFAYLLLSVDLNYYYYDSDLEAERVPVGAAGVDEALRGMAGPPMAMPGNAVEQGESAEDAKNGGGATLQKVERIRSEFPEAWIWTEIQSRYNLLGL